MIGLIEWLSLQSRIAIEKFEDNKIKEKFMGERFEMGLQPGPGNDNRDHGGTLPGVLAQAGGESSTGGTEGAGI